MEQFLSYAIIGGMVGFIYSLFAIAFVIIYRGSGVLNIAVGQFAMFGAYIAWTITARLGWSWWAAFLIVISVAILISLAVERFALRPLVGQDPLATIFMTLGLAVFFDALMGLLFGYRYQALPRLLPGKEFYTILGVQISADQLGAAVIAIVIVIALSVFFKYSRWGLAMRAAADDQQGAQVVGVSVKRVLQYSWIISTVVASIGGILLCLSTAVHYTNSALGLKAISVLLLGGLESVLGALIAGPIMGIVEYVGAGYGDPFVFGGGLRDVIPFAAVLILILVLPCGLFGWKKIERV